MLKKTNRLNQAEFTHFFKVGKRSHSGSIQLIYSPYHRFHGSVVVPKKLVKKAVDRNKLRRQLYSSLHSLLVNKKQTGVYIVVVKRNSLELKNELVDLVGATINKG